MNHQPPKKALLLGIGLDNEDGHKRITQAKDFVIAGGSEETHERLAETAIKTVEHLGCRGKTLAETDPGELNDIISENTP